MFRIWKLCRCVDPFRSIRLHNLIFCAAQKYSNAAAQSNTISQDTIHLLFPGLNKLLNFQRKFLIRLESTAEVPWKDQRWGLHFIENVRLLFSCSGSGLELKADLPLSLSLFSFRSGHNRRRSSRSTNHIVPTTQMQRTS